MTAEHLIRTAKTPTLAESAEAPAGPSHPGLRTRVIYGVYREALSSVFHSQVLTPLTHLREEHDVEIAALVPWGHRWRRKWRTRLDEVRGRCTEAGVKLTWLPSPPTRTPWLFDEVRRFRKWIRRHHTDQPVVLHCRGSVMAGIALDAKAALPNLRVIFDCRGAEAAELEQFLTTQTDGSDIKVAEENRKRVQEAEQRERRAVQLSDHVLCVSRVMRESLIASHGISPEKVSVVPCCLPETRISPSVQERDRVRQQLGLDDRLVVTYCGSMAWYQMPQQSLSVFRQIRQSDPSAHFLAITTQPDAMRARIAEAEIPAADATVVTLPPDEVASHLSAADIGLLLRDDSLVNRVASPVKFGEYMAAGLPVIVSEHLGDYSEAVRTGDLGVVTSLDGEDRVDPSVLDTFLSSLRSDRSAYRQRCRQFARTQLSWEENLSTISDAYHQLSITCEN